MPSTTALAINVFLRTSHDVMPNYQLSHEEIDDVVAFIMSLKGKKMP
jgi:mono/diheme cytochrome c family protein